MDVSANKRKVKPCYWESQPGGCKKPHCPFLHDKPKEPYSQEVMDLIEQKAKSQTIIVNKNKMGELSNLILPVKVDEDEQRRVIATERSIKDRLGPVKGRISVKDRLGGFNDPEDLEEANLELYECDEQSESEDEEANRLRMNAIKTIDLRKRIHANKDDEEDEEEEVRTVKSVVKKVKKEKKEKKKKKKEKKEKRAKLKEKDDEVKGKRIVRSGEDEEKLSSEGEQEELEDKEMSLADKIAARRENQLASAKVKLRLGKRDDLDEERVSRKRHIDKGQDAAEKVKKSKPDETEEQYEPIGDRKLRLRKKSEKEAKAEMDEVEKFLKENDGNTSMDVMKELDELLKD